MDWHEAAELFAEASGRAVVIGAVDTGKTTFCAELLKCITGRGSKAALIDCDVGQSTLGPPGTIGAKVFAGKDPIGPEPHPPFMWFIGSASPENRIIQAVLGASAAARWVEGSEPCPIVVDTTGLVGGDKARRLKACKIEAVGADMVFGLQRRDEIEHILLPLEARSLKVIRVSCPSGVICRSPEMRRRYRAERFASYFTGARTMEISLAGIAVYECPLDLARLFPTRNVMTFQPPTRRGEARNLLVGLGGRRRHTLAVGCILGLDAVGGKLRLAVPRLPEEEVAFIEIGNLTVEEAPHCQGGVP